MLISKFIPKKFFHLNQELYFHLFFTILFTLVFILVVEQLFERTAYPFICGNLNMNIGRYEFKVIFNIPLHSTSSNFWNSLLPILNILETKHTNNQSYGWLEMQ